MVAAMETEDAQRDAALKNANRTRAARAQLKREIAAHRRNPIRVLKVPPAFAETMKVENLLLAVPGLGSAKVERLLRSCEIEPGTTLGALSGIQRAALAHGLKEKAWLT